MPGVNLGGAALECQGCRPAFNAAAVAFIARHAQAA